MMRGGMDESEVIRKQLPRYSSRMFHAMPWERRRKNIIRDLLEERRTVTEC